jgi:hypothetical protein
MGRWRYFHICFSDLICLKAGTPKHGYESKMALDPAQIVQSPLTVPNSAKVVQCLLAHARLCREIASLSWNEADARKLEEMAAECVRRATGESSPAGPPH